MIDIRVFHGKEAWIDGITDDFIQALAEIPVSRQPRFCLAGGQTPEPAYRVLSQLMVAGRAGQAPAILVPGDERVPDDEWGPGNKRGLIGQPADLNETMLSRSFAKAIASGVANLYSWFDEEMEWVAAGPGSASRVGSNLNPGYDLAQAMIQTMKARLAQLVFPGQPLFDLCYLGMGADGHTAGLFPGMPGLEDPGLCVRGLAPTPPRQRVSLGFSALVSTGKTRFIISASGKEAALTRLRSGDPSCPAVMASTTDTIAFVLA